MSLPSARPLNAAQRKFLWLMRLSLVWKIAALAALVYLLVRFGVI